MSGSAIVAQLEPSLRLRISACEDTASSQGTVAGAFTHQMTRILPADLHWETILPNSQCMNAIESISLFAIRMPLLLSNGEEIGYPRSGVPSI
jgi:hypothetical protein